MIEIEKYSCSDGNEARARERHWYELLSAKLNSNVPNRSLKEGREVNAPQKKEYDKVYREENKEEIKLKKIQYAEENKEKIKQTKHQPHVCECGKTICHGEISRHKKTQHHLKYTITKLSQQSTEN